MDRRTITIGCTVDELHELEYLCQNVDALLVVLKIHEWVLTPNCHEGALHYVYCTPHCNAKGSNGK